MTRFFAEYGLAAVFGFVLIEQLGAPIPALPILLVAGAKTIENPVQGVYALAVAILACTVADSAWFWAGRRYGYRVLKLLCRVAISPDSCVSRAEDAYERRGVATLVIAKFVPGLATAAPPVAGALGLRTSSFLLFNALGAALWSGTALVLGLLFHGQIDWLMERLADLGGYATLLLAVLLALYVAYRVWDRWRFLRTLRTARVSVDELYGMMNRGEDPMVLDVRSRAHRTLDGRSIPGALAVDLDNLDSTLAEIPRDREVVVYCACPNEASAVRIALLLRERGIHRVRPLAGGIDAWVAAGMEIDDAVIES